MTSAWQPGISLTSNSTSGLEWVWDNHMDAAWSTLEEAIGHLLAKSSTSKVCYHCISQLHCIALHCQTVINVLTSMLLWGQQSWFFPTSTGGASYENNMMWNHGKSHTSLLLEISAGSLWLIQDVCVHGKDRYTFWEGGMQRALLRASPLPKRLPSPYDRMQAAWVNSKELKKQYFQGTEMELPSYWSFP